jgi:hypothetical protein
MRERPEIDYDFRPAGYWDDEATLQLLLRGVASAADRTAIVAYWAWRASPGRWGWVGVAHFVATSLVVVATANHYWLDGIVAMGILAVALVLQASVPVLVRASRPGSARPDTAEEPALV